MRGKLVLDDGEVDDDELEDGFTFVSLEDSIDAVARAIELPAPWIEPHDTDPAPAITSSCSDALRANLRVA